MTKIIPQEKDQKIIFFITLLLSLVVFIPMTVWAAPVDTEALGRDWQEIFSNCNFFLNKALAIATNTDLYDEILDTLQVDALVESIQTLASTILGIEIAIEITQEIDRKYDEFRVEDVIRLLLKFLIIKNIIDLAPTILDACYETATIMLNAVSGSPCGTGSLEEGMMAFAQQMADSYAGQEINLLNFNIQILTPMLLKTLAFGVKVVGLLVMSVMVGRLFQIAMLTLFAPIPMAFCGWQETRETTKRFLLSYFAVCLQAVIIQGIFNVYSTICASSELMNTLFGLSEEDPSRINYLFWFQILLLIILVKSVFSSGQWAKEIVGAA